ncbi:hypothetical protein GJ496_008705 [Pomphorhynchus laevis]|nr:hypothetical protein GJ496_008705 [Pomphorhynchus laevis]
MLMPLAHGGIGIKDPCNFSNTEYERSVAMCEPLLSGLKESDLEIKQRDLIKLFIVKKILIECIDPPSIQLVDNNGNKLTNQSHEIPSVDQIASTSSNLVSNVDTAYNEKPPTKKVYFIRRMIERRIGLWSEGHLSELFDKARILPTRIAPRYGVNVQKQWIKQYCKYSNGTLKPSDVVDELTVHEHLQKLHSRPTHVQNDALLGEPLPDSKKHDASLFAEIDGNWIVRAARRTHESADCALGLLVHDFYSKPKKIFDDKSMLA